MNQGTYGNQFAGAMISNNNGKWNTSLTLQASRRETGERLKTDRRIATDSLFSQNAYTRYPGNTYFGYYSIGYTPGKKWDLTCDGRISVNNNSSQSGSPAIIEQISTGIASVNYNTAVNNNTNNVNVTQRLSTKYKPDTSGSEWTTDLSYNYVPAASTQSYNTTYTLPKNAAITGNGNIHTHLQFISLRTDMIKKLPFKSSIEMGIKMTGVWFDNNTNYTITYKDTTANDAQRTNAYKYDEQIYAGYLQASKSFGSILVKAGARLENTNMNGNQSIPADTNFKLNRTDLFPYIYISRKVMRIAGFDLRGYLIYRRTISRPTYEYLNPFPKYVDQYVSETGNPSLRPQFTKNYEANISLDERPLFAFGYNDMTDIFSQVVYQADSSHLHTYRTYDNLGSNKEVYLRGLGGIPPGRAYFFIIGAQYNHNFYQGQYEGAPLYYKHSSWTIFTYHRLTLSKLTQLTLNGFVRFKGQVQFYELSTFGSLNISINHQFLQKKLKVTLSVTDIFLTNNNEFSIDQGDIHATGLRKGDTRRFGLNVSYNFGIHKKEEHNFLNEETPETSSKNN
ncbi:MAG: outer membrane beta-barrel family protein [Chitinophagales bacterium]